MILRKNTLNSVATIIPVHIYNSLVKKAINSALNQNYNNNKVYVVINSTETDIEDKINNEFSNDIQIINIKEIGVSYARNAGITHSKSEYVAFLDSDDTWSEDKLTSQIDFMVDNNYFVCGSLMNYITERENSNIYVGNAKFTQEQVRSAIFMPFPISSLIVKREVLDENNLFSVNLGTNAYAQIEDLELISRLAYKYKVGVHLKRTGKYLINTKGITSNKLFIQRSAGYMLSDMRKEGNEGFIDNFSYKVVKSRKIYHELFRYRMIESYVNKKYLSSLFFTLIIIMLKPLLTIKKIYQKNITS